MCEVPPPSKREHYWRNLETKRGRWQRQQCTSQQRYHPCSCIVKPTGQVNRLRHADVPLDLDVLTVRRVNKLTEFSRQAFAPPSRYKCSVKRVRFPAHFCSVCWPCFIASNQLLLTMSVAHQLFHQHTFAVDTTARQVLTLASFSWHAKKIQSHAAFLHVCLYVFSLKQ